MLGDVFIRNFYTTFDYKAGTVSFAVSTNAPAGVKIEKKLSTWAITVICVGSFIGFVICFFKYMNSCENKKSDDDEEDSEISN